MSRELSDCVELHNIRHMYSILYHAMCIILTYYSVMLDYADARYDQAANPGRLDVLGENLLSLRRLPGELTNNDGNNGNTNYLTIR